MFREQAPAELRGYGVVQLDQDDSGDAVVGVEEAECGAGGVERLGDDDAAHDCGVNLRGNVVGEKTIARRVAPAPEKCHAEQQNIEPINQQGRAIVNVFGEQRRGEGNQADDAEEGNVNPGEVAIGTGEMVELGLLADPEDAKGHNTHQKDQQARGEYEERFPEIVLGVDGFAGGNPEIEDEEGHGHGEYAIAERGKAFDGLSGNAVVERWHRRESSGNMG